ncbi:PSP domain-containing protein [Ditylenchus destructor]|nr:PSP domain-containing protein [Ditylenchus destructor]
MYNIYILNLTKPRLHEQLENGITFKPGVVSDSLREALGLGPRDIPEWIYRMRKKGIIEGYPPAYLKRATEKSVLNFVVSDTDPSTATEAQDVVDPAKIISYYGFNKEDKTLIDPERFQVPQWDKFIAAHQKVLDNRSFLLQPPPVPPTQNENGTPNTKKQKYKHRGSPPPEKKKKRRNVNGANSSTSENGSATPKTTMGTPILMNKLISADKMNHEVLKPSLDNFSHDILPFRHTSEVPETGFFKKLQGFVKGLRTSKEEKK